jgi:glycosyltransferase involved in cell wall biosynthesis
MVRKPAVLVLASTYPRWPGDHEPGFVHELCKRLATKFEVVVLTSRSPGAAASEIMDGVEVVRYRYAPRRMETLVYGGGITTHLRRSPWKLIWVPWFVIGQYLSARRIIKHRKVDVIHAHWLVPQGIVARRLSRRFKQVPYLVTSHGSDLFGLRTKCMKVVKQKVAKDCSAMTVVSQSMREEVEHLNLSPKFLDVIPMGVDMQVRFTPCSDTRRSHAEILFVGRLIEQKGLKYLIDALNFILPTRPDTFLTIAGFGPDADARREQVDALKLQGRVNFLGAVRQEELPDLYRRAAVCVVPSVKREGLGLVAVEASACGCPVIIGEAAGVRELLGDTAADICVDPRDSRAMAGAIMSVLDDPSKASARAMVIRRTAAQQIDWQVVTDRYASVIEACLLEGSSPEPSV